MAEAARAPHAGPDALFLDTNHLNPTGHEQAAAWIAAYLLDENLLAR